jgi:hypothetical protein
MTTNFLVVCGDMGEGLVNQRENLGFDGILQFDTVGRPLLDVWNNSQMNFFESHGSDDYQRRVYLPIENWEQYSGAKPLQVEFISHEILYNAINQYRKASNNQLSEKLKTHHRLVEKYTIPHEISDLNLIAVWRAFMEDKYPKEKIYCVIEQMFSERRQLELADEVTVWIIASMDGMGQGVLYNVIDIINKVTSNIGNLNVKIRLVHGVYNYKWLHSGLEIETPYVRLKRLLGILSDYGYLQYLQTYQHFDRNNNIATCYLDLALDKLRYEDRRSKLSEMTAAAFTAITNPRVASESVLIGSQMMNHAVYTRVKEWQIQKDSSFAQIVEKLNNEVFTDETAEAVWWHGNPRRSNEKNASIRLLPWMDEREQSELRRASELWSQQTGLSAPEYFFSSSQAQNMSVFAIDMIATPNTITQVESLIYHLIPYINPLNYEFRSGFDDASQRERFESIICQHSTGVPIFCSSTWANQHSPFGKLHEIIHSLNKYFTIIDEHGNIV